MGLDARSMENKATGFIILLLWPFIGCASAPEPAGSPVIHAEERVPDQESWKATVYLFQDARNRIVLDANHRLYYQADQETIFDEGLTVRFFDENGRLSSTLTADRGRILESSRNMTVHGNVLIVSSEHGRLETDSLKWVEQENRITTGAVVRLSTARDVVTGVGFEADPNLDEWRIFRDIKGRFDRGDELEEQFSETKDP